MTFETLSTIHSVLAEARRNLSEDVDNLRHDYYETERLYEQKVTGDMELQDAKTRYKSAMENLRRVEHAIREFEDHDWR